MIIITNISGNDALVNARQKMLVFYTGHPALDAGSRIQGLDSRFHGNDKRGDAGSIPSRHPQPKAKRFGLGIHSDWIPVFTGMTRELDFRLHGNDRENNGNYREEYRNNKTSEVATLEIAQLYQ